MIYFGVWLTLLGWCTVFELLFVISHRFFDWTLLCIVCYRVLLISCTAYVCRIVAMNKTTRSFNYETNGISNIVMGQMVFGLNFANSGKNDVLY